MAAILAAALFAGTMAMPPAPQQTVPHPADTQPAEPQTTESQPADKAERPAGALPPAPAGRSTIMGGSILKVDPVNDSLVLAIHGQRPATILYDSRTRIFRDGFRIPLRDLKAGEHASVQTVLDGASVFAVSVHILSGTPAGEIQGTVQSFDPDRGILSVSSSLQSGPVELRITPRTRILRTGQASPAPLPAGPADLLAGALVSVSFAGEQNAVREITVLAAPNATFQFSGNIFSIDMHTGLLVVEDPRDGRHYEIHFSPGLFPDSRNLHPGSNVTVRARWTGAQYVASTIAIGRP